MDESAKERLERITQNQEALDAVSGRGNMRLISAENLDFLLTHARRSIEAETAEGEAIAFQQAVQRFYIDNGGKDDGKGGAIRAGLSAAALYRAAHPTDVPSRDCS